MMVEIDAASCYMKKTNLPMTKSLSKLMKQPRFGSAFSFKVGSTTNKLDKEEPELCGAIQSFRICF